jgi:hypothetical protein
VNALGEGNKDRRDAELVVSKIFENIGIKRENEDFMAAHDAREELHDEDFVVEGKALVIAVEVVVQFFGEGLGVVEQLKGGKIGRGGFGGFIFFL